MKLRKFILPHQEDPFLITKTSAKKIKPSDALKHPKWKMGKK